MTFAILYVARPKLLLSLLLLALCVVPLSAQKHETKTAPDLSKGGVRPEGWTHDWNLGPTGARGWIFSDKHTTTSARQILITEVAKGSPADGVLRTGDVLLGVGGKTFDDDARILFAKAITQAESKKGAGKLKLKRWRSGKNRDVVLKLRVLGSYGDSAPFDCPKSKLILKRGLKTLAKNLETNPKAGSPITRALGALALLASGDKKYMKVVRKQAEILSKFGQASGVRTWHYAYINVFLAEYVLATGDKRQALKGLRRITKMIVEGQSSVGSWGHGFVQKKSGRLGGYGMMNAPGIPLTYSLALAREAGVKVPGLDDAIRKSKDLLRFYVGKGSIPYGDHESWIETHCDNGKNEAAAVLFDFEGETAATEYFSRMAVSSHGAEREEGHTGNYFNLTWAMLGVGRSGPEATGAWLKEFGWYYDLARRWDGSFLHQGPPTAKPESYDKWDASGPFLLAYAQPQKQLFITGKKTSSAPVIDRATAESLVDDGRGWTNKDRKSFYRAKKTAELLKDLKSWSPVVRERAAMELGDRKDHKVVVPRLIKLLSSQSLYARLGACRGLRFQKRRGAPAVAALIENLDAEDLWLRIQAAQALAGVGDPARIAVPKMLARLNREAKPNDPRNMEQRYLTMALFDRRDGLLGRSLKDVDEAEVLKAVRASLQNEDGRARGAVASVYNNLSFEQLKPLLPAIIEAIAVPSPSGIMFADTIRTAGLKLLAKHRVSEGIELIAAYARNQKQHASEHRIVDLMVLLSEYGAHAQRVTKDLEATAKFFEEKETDFPKRLSLEKARIVREAIRQFKKAKDRPKLILLSS